MRLQKTSWRPLAALLATCLVLCLMVTTFAAPASAAQNNSGMHVVLTNEDPVIYEPIMKGEAAWARAHGYEVENLDVPATEPLEPATGIHGQHLTQVLYPELETVNTPDGEYYLTVG